MKRDTIRRIYKLHIFLSSIPKIRNLYAKQKSIVRARRKICNQTKAQALQRHPVLPSAEVHGYQRSKSFTPFIKINCNTAHFISRITLCRRYFTAVHFIEPEEVSDISIIARTSVSTTGYRGSGRRSNAGSVGCFKITVVPGR